MLWPVKTKQTVSHCQNNNVKEEGIPPARNNLCTLQLAVSTAVWNRQAFMITVTLDSVFYHHVSLSFNVMQHDYELKIKSTNISKQTPELYWFISPTYWRKATFQTKCLPWYNRTGWPSIRKTTTKLLLSNKMGWIKNNWSKNKVKNLPGSPTPG